ncbi:MAG: light-regulated signal transduction histidine kinase (bacteriophytochrome) [Candidatus Azotimanducaceae bacterium]
MIENGIEFSASKASLVISVRAYRSGKDFTFEIQDNGIGILPVFFDRIFTLFQRLHHRDECSGNGIGLSICKKFVLCHGCRIWVESIYCEGATFKFTLPASPLP